MADGFAVIASRTIIVNVLIVKIVIIETAKMPDLNWEWYNNQFPKDNDMSDKEFMNRAPFTAFKASNRIKHQFDSGNYCVRVEAEHMMGMKTVGSAEIVETGKNGQPGKIVWTGPLDNFVELANLMIFSVSKADLK